MFTKLLTTQSTYKIKQDNEKKLIIIKQTHKIKFEKKYNKLN